MLLGDFVALAAVFAFAFLGGYIAQRSRQSVVVGYIIAGVVLGSIAIAWAPLGDDLFQDTAMRQLNTPVQVVFDFGITFLMFFIGMEISLRRLAGAGRAATIVAVADTGFNIFGGVLIGSLLGWGWKDIFFLSGIILMSSLSVAAKSLIDLRRLDNRETEFLLSVMVVEAFIAMVLLSLSTSLVAVGGVDQAAGSVTDVAVAVAIVYVTLIAVAMFMVPWLAKRIETVRNEEVFILLALTMVFSAAALAWYFGLPFMVGAFFMGIAFSETALTDRLRIRLGSLRDAFTAAFFVGFGAMIDLGRLAQVQTLVIIALAVPFILLAEMVLTASVAFIVGLSRREVVNMGTALIGRGEDAILFASIGGRLKNADGQPALAHGPTLYPVAGGIALITSVITPRVMRASSRIADALGRAIPPWLGFGGTLVQRTVVAELSPLADARHGRPVALAASLLAFFASVLSLIAFFQSAGELVHVVAIVVSLIVWALTVVALRARARKLMGDVDLKDLNLLLKDRRTLADYVAYMLATLMLLGLLLVALTPFSIVLGLAVPAVLVPAMLVLSHRAHARAAEPPQHMRAREMLEQQVEAEGLGVRRRKGGDPR